MNYKYQRKQIFGKRLNVPKNILKDVYRCTLSFNDFIEYQLEDKIPISCIKESDRRIVEKFGIDKCKELDWELINGATRSYFQVRDILMSLDPQTENINNALYELVKDQISLREYSSKMKKVYSDRFFDVSQSNDKKTEHLMNSFNDGNIRLEEIVLNWNLFKNKDLSYYLLKDNENKNHITDAMLKEFMSNYGVIASLIVENKFIIENSDIYTFFNNISSLNSEKEKQEFIKIYTDDILSKTIEKNARITLTTEQYKEIFKYSSMEEYLEYFNKWAATKIVEELESLPKDYVYNMPIPFLDLLNTNVMDFVGYFGLKNTVDFDNECGHFFTQNNCKMLKSMGSIYLWYFGRVTDKKRTLDTRNNIDEKGRYIDRPYTKDEFYEAMRRMIIYGPSDSKDALDYRGITGEFRIKNPELFISEQAPEDLQKHFYTKSMTPQLLLSHPEYIPYLNGKDLSLCFAYYKNREVEVEGCNTLDGKESIYRFLSSKTDVNGVMNFITEYSDALDALFDNRILNYSQYRVRFSINDDINQISDKINELLRKIIIEERCTYPKIIPKKLIKKYPSMFLDKNAPLELKEAFYNRNISSEFILSNPSYREYLKNVDLEVLFKYMPINITNKENESEQINLISGIKQVVGSSDAFDIIPLYEKYIEKIFENNKFQNFDFNSNYSKDDLLDELDKAILQSIIDDNMKYDESVPSHFKNNNPTLFLSQNVSDKIRNKFYNREFTLKDFSDNPELIEIFDKTNIVYGFSGDISWFIPLFSNSDNMKKANYKRIEVILAYSKIQDNVLQKLFKNFITKFENSINTENIKLVSDVLSRINLSNSSEIFRLREELVSQILGSNNPLENLNKIEDKFIRNNIPTVGKVYSCFEILHPDFQGFDFEKSKISPILKKSSNASRKIIVFSDLIKSAFGSNNKSVNSYLRNIEVSSELYERIKNNQIEFDILNENEKQELLTFSKHLATLYENTMKGKNETFISSGNVIKDIYELSKKISPNGTSEYNLADRVIRMFCGFAGIDTLKEAEEYIDKKIKTADLRNRNASNSDMTLEKGDFIKGIGGITYLRNILQNGSVSKEYLGSSADSDATPLDTDISMIMRTDGTINEKILETAANEYGPLWLVLKNDDRFISTRTIEGEIETKRDMSKMEVFYTGVCGPDHYGIRTGFASSEINYIVMEPYDPRVGLEITMNGFYIPVANKEGKIIFTPKDYDELRAKMSGLSYFGEQDYSFSENLVTKETEYLASQIEQSNYEVQVKREKINNIIKKSLEELGLHLKTNIDGDLTEGFVELIDTGSTGRGTNKPGDGDFDFMLRLDNKILSNLSKLNELKQTILRNFDRENSSELTLNGDFRLKKVQIDNDTNVDIDITFTQKTDKVLYSTDMALQDRLTTIQRNSPEKYKYVVANILLAKQVLKQAEAYKPNRGEIPQGGLGGVGIENWILQNGGSFIDAAKSFVEAADGKSFSEFTSAYQIWDFGDNHLAERRGFYPHDNFVSNNMGESGYQKMVQALKEYLKNIEMEQVQIEGVKRQV